MSDKHTRMEMLLDLIRIHKGISKADLISRMQARGEHLSERTIERYLVDLRNHYAAEIEYDPNTRGYQLHSESQPHASFQNFRKQHVLGGALQQLMDRGVKVWKVVDVDDQSPAIDPELFSQLIQAILDKKRVKIHYHKFYEDEASVYTIAPSLLKQTLKRWYLLGDDVSSGTHAEPKSWGMERIVSVQVLEQAAQPNPEKFREMTRYIYGISRFGQEQVWITLHTNAWQGKYFETLPVNSSQRVKSIADDLVEVSFKAVINVELLQMLVGQIQYLKVVSPPELVAEYQEFVRRKFKEL